ncbi:ATP-binding protein [Thalassobaculum sp. OXR-137]|uniref:sensor histidine kinase n=1 Tax=Thalassobaculum sp. OXR-137 TaxID=3100173 RepID=UPI002AC98711|nr:ATP-binding protein [Thalassobaculum sp. OXR-137]WPZ35898.1 ATP-binding protein [Thalassobaculum sp. OXR-137]
MNLKPVERSLGVQPRFTTKSTIGELAGPAVVLPDDVTLREVAGTFFARPALTALVIDGSGGREPALIPRGRFTEFQSRPFFDELFAGKPVDAYLHKAGGETLVFEADAPIYEVAEIALDRDGAAVYDPIVVTPDDGPPTLADMRDLVRAQAEILRSSSRNANETLSRFLKSQEELLQARKMEAVGTLSAGLAHELNTPLQFLGSNVTFLESLYEDYHEAFAALGPSFQEDWCEEYPSAVHDMQMGLARMAEIVAAMKTFSDREGTSYAQIDVNETIRTAVTLIRGRIRQGADLRLELAESLPEVRGVANSLAQAWVNVLTNAIQAVESSDPERPRIISIRSTAADGTVTVEIADTGTGMAEDVAARCFEPFFTTRPPGHGAGQGLTTVHRSITLEHRGRIEIESAPGVGTTVHVALPAE